jgi:8-oxo-dGTP diphosphatase
VFYRQLKVGAGAIIEKQDAILLFQRAYDPFQGDWNIPAGYAEHDEDPAHTVIREVYEETGLQVQVDQLHDVYFFADDPRGNGLLIVYTCQILGGELTESHEGGNFRFFARHDLPGNLAGGGHNQAVLSWKAAEQT